MSPWYIATRLHEDTPHIRTRDEFGEEYLVARVGHFRSEVNACLIASVPALLEALKEMAGYHQSTIDSDPNHGYTLHAQRRVEAAVLLVAKLGGWK